MGQGEGHHAQLKWGCDKQHRIWVQRARIFSSHLLAYSDQRCKRLQEGIALDVVWKRAVLRQECTEVVHNNIVRIPVSYRKTINLGR